MAAWKARIAKHAPLLWWGACGLFALVAVGCAVGVLLSGRTETDDAFDSGRRLVIAMDTGEVQGKNLTLDAPVPPPVAPKVETPPPIAETPPAPAAETPPAPDGSETPAAPAAEAPAAELPPATPTPDVNPELIEKADVGNLPIISKDGTKPWRYYSKPFERKRNQPMIAVVVSNLGTGRKITQDALALPENITLAFSPYARDIGGWMPAIRATGHELLVDLPLEPSNYPATDPGPHGMLLAKGPEDMEKQLQWVMSRYPAYIGFLTPQNESFTKNDEGMKALLQSMANRGLLMVLGREPYKKETMDYIDTTHSTVVVGNVLLDEEPSEASIQQRLALLEEYARKTGYAIGVAQPYPITIEQLKAWAASLEEKGIILVPVSAIAKLRFS